MITIATITPKFQIHLPKAVREKSGLVQHGLVAIRADKGKITITPVKQKDILSLAGSFIVSKPIAAEKLRGHIDYSGL
jgi:AbrB family looped-hinge helix DNA binding protein